MQTNDNVKGAIAYKPAFQTSFSGGVFMPVGGLIQVHRHQEFGIGPGFGKSAF
jgi:hypothetical protein